MISFALLYVFFAYISRMEAGSITSTVALRDAEGDEKGTQCLGDIDTEMWPSSFGVGRRDDDLAL
jgi:hypothetical protein